MLSAAAKPTETAQNTGEQTGAPAETLAPEAKVLNDAWERSYGDLQWQTLGEKTVYSPRYFLAEKDGKVRGCGVETGPGAMCCREISAKGVTLVLDVRAGEA